MSSENKENQDPQLTKFIDTIKSLPDDKLEVVWQGLRNEVNDRNVKHLKAGGSNLANENI